MAEGTRHEGRDADIGTVSLRGLDREARQRQLADVEFRLAKGAEENFLRRKRHAGRLDAVDLYGSVDQCTRAIVRTNGDGQTEFGHEEPGWITKPRAVISEMTAPRYSTPRFWVFSSGVTSIDTARPVMATGPRQSFMQGSGFQKVFSLVSRSSSKNPPLFGIFTCAQVSFESTNVSSTMSLR